MGIGGEVRPRAIWWIGSGVVAPSTRMGPPLTESPGQCRGYERRRAGSPRGANTTARCVKRVLKGWREQGHGIGCRPGALLAVARFRERPAMNAGQVTATCTTRKTSGPPPQGRRHCRFETGASRAGNDCDAFCSAMERGQDGPRETVVDAKRVGRSSGRLESAAICGGLRVALARPGDCGKAHLLSQSCGQRGGGRA